MKNSATLILLILLALPVMAGHGIRGGLIDETHSADVLISNYGPNAMYIAADFRSGGPDGKVDVVYGVVSDFSFDPVSYRLDHVRIVVQESRVIVISQAERTAFVFDHGQACEECDFPAGMTVHHFTGYGMLRRDGSLDAPLLDKIKHSKDVSIAVEGGDEWAPWEPWDGGGGAGATSCTAGGSGATSCSIGSCGHSCSVSCAAPAYACCNAPLCSPSCKCIK